MNGLITLQDSEPEPDIAIVRLPESAYSDRHPGPDDTLVLVEVAKTSLKKDLEIKTTVYAAVGIQDYWVINLTAREISVFRSPRDGRYTFEETFREGTITPLTFPDVQVSVERLLN